MFTLKAASAYPESVVNYWSLSRAAQALDADLCLIIQLVRSGDLPVYQVGSSGCYRIHVSDLVDLLHPIDGRAYCAAFASDCLQSEVSEEDVP